MPLLGRNGAVLLGKQTAIGTKQSTLIQKVFQTSGGGIGPHCGVRSARAK